MFPYTVEIIDGNGTLHLVKTSAEDPEQVSHQACQDIGEVVAGIQRDAGTDPDDEDCVEPGELDPEIEMAIDDFTSIRVFDGHHDEIYGDMNPVYQESEFDGVSTAHPLMHEGQDPLMHEGRDPLMHENGRRQPKF